MSTDEKVLSLLEQLTSDMSDLKAGQARLEARMDKLEGRMDKLEGRLDKLEKGQERTNRAIGKVKKELKEWVWGDIRRLAIRTDRLEQFAGIS